MRITISKGSTYSKNYVDIKYLQNTKSAVDKAIAELSDKQRKYGENHIEYTLDLIKVAESLYSLIPKYNKRKIDLDKSFSKETVLDFMRKRKSLIKFLESEGFYEMLQRAESGKKWLHSLTLLRKKIIYTLEAILLDVKSAEVWERRVCNGDPYACLSSYRLSERVNEYTKGVEHILSMSSYNNEFNYKPKQKFGSIKFDDISGAGITKNHKDILYLGAILYMTPTALLELTKYKGESHIDVDIDMPVASPYITVSFNKIIEFGNIDVGIYAYNNNVDIIPVHVTFGNGKKAVDIDSGTIAELFGLHTGIVGIFVDGKGFIRRGDIDAY